MERHEINDVAPTSLSHVIGQEGVVAQVAVALEAAFADARKLDDCLLVGGAGLGKTQVAKVIAAELASRCHEVLGQAVLSPADLNGLLLEAGPKDVVFIDEAHELPRGQQTALYLALDQRRIVLAGGRSGRTPQSIPLADFTLLLATTDEFKLLQPLRDRMKLTLRFEFYRAEDLVELVRQRSRGLGWAVDEDVLAPIAARSRGTPRLALRLLQSCRRVCRSESENAVPPDHLHRACSLEKMDGLGLGPTERHYLMILAGGEPPERDLIPTRPARPHRRRGHEPFLIRSGLVMKDDHGRRQLTAGGREHLSRNRP